MNVIQSQLLPQVQQVTKYIDGVTFSTRVILIDHYYASLPDITSGDHNTVSLEGIFTEEYYNRSLHNVSTVKSHALNFRFSSNSGED